jgi:hypothetical protein
VIPRSYLFALLVSFAILLVTFAVVMAGYGLAKGMGDTAAAAVLWYLGMTSLAALVILLILLICTMALIMVGPSGRQEEADEEE